MPLAAPSMNAETPDFLTSVSRSWAAASLRAARRVGAAASEILSSGTTGSELTGLRQAVIDAERRTEEGSRIITSPRAATAALIEIRNKANVYFLVRSNQLLLGIPSPLPQPFLLDTYLRRAYERNAYAALWAVEGLGRLLGESHLEAGNNASAGLLCDDAAGTLPEESLLMLHAGIGLAFAQRGLAGLAAHSSPSVFREVIAWFAAICQRNSMRDYLGAALESLGLVTRTFYRTLVPNVDRAITDTDPDLRGYFWHGVGRAIYFLPVNFLPCSTWETVVMCEREGPDEFSRLNLFAGVAWGMVMVNIQNPVILAELIVKPHGSQLLGNRGFRYGAASSLIMRESTTPGAQLAQSFIDYYLGDGSSSDERTLWDTLIRRPGHEALTRIGPSLKAQHSLDRLFRYTDLF